MFTSPFRFITALALALTGLSLMTTTSAEAGLPAACTQSQNFQYVGPTGGPASNGLQTFSVPAGVTQINVTAAGGVGGALAFKGFNRSGGNGVVLTDDNIPVPAGATQLTVLVGGTGGSPVNGVVGSGNAGGGGGSFIYTTPDAAGTLVVAGGGGGADNFGPGANASIAETGTATAPATVGAIGSGGDGYNNPTGAAMGAGGAGLLAGGGAGLSDPNFPTGPLPASTNGYGVQPPAGQIGSSGGSSLSVGGAGGASDGGFDGSGGFGGGGGAGGTGGGGGGYSGGAGGVGFGVGGGGGGSYSIVTPATAAATNTGNGYVDLSWTAPDDKVTFNLNGGTGTPPNSESIACGSSATDPGVTPMRPGYTFADWSTSPDGVTGNYFANPTALTADTTLYAQWTTAIAVPIVTPHSYSTPNGQALNVAAPGLLAGAAGSAATGVNIATPPTDGTVQLNSDGSFTYTPVGGFVGIDSFTYTASNTGGTSAPATATITVGAPPNQSVTVTANSTSMTYGSPLPALTGTVAPPAGATMGRCSTTATASSPVGTYPITCSGTANIGYSLTNTAGTLTIKPAHLLVTAPSPTMAQGTVVPALTPTYSGFVNGDGPRNLKTPATCTTAATAASPTGSYPIACSGAANPNYDIAYAPGTLKITPPITSNVTLTLYTYNGNTIVISFALGAAPPKPLNPTRSGYTFNGWYTAPVGGIPFDFTTPVLANTQAYAHWSQVVTRVTVSPNIVKQGGSVTVTGTGFQPGEPVSAVIHSKALSIGTQTADASGVVIYHATIPVTFPAAHHTVVLIGQMSHRTATAPLTVTADTGKPKAKKHTYPTQAATGYGDPTPVPPNRTETPSLTLAVLDRRRNRLLAER